MLPDRRMVAPARSVSPMFIGTSLVPVVGRGLFDDGVSLHSVVGCSPLVEDGGVGVGGAEVRMAPLATGVVVVASWVARW